MAVGIAHAEARGAPVRLLPERHQAARRALGAGRLEVSARAADAERDVVEPGRAPGKRRPLGAGDLQRDVVVMDARGQEGDAPALAPPGLAQAEEIPVEGDRGVEVADEERDVAQLGDPHGTPTLARAPGGPGPSPLTRSRACA